VIELLVLFGCSAISLGAILFVLATPRPPGHFSNEGALVRLDKRLAQVEMKIEEKGPQVGQDPGHPASA
jgi:hypothetical protein